MLKSIFISLFLAIVFYFLGAFWASDAQANNKIKVMIIDTGVYPHYSYRSHIHENTSLADYFPSGNHGTHLAGIIMQRVCEEVELVSCNYDVIGYNECLKIAGDIKPDFINYSLTGPHPDDLEQFLMESLIKQGTVISVPSGNNNKDLSENCNEFPACYKLKGLHVVGALDNNTRAPYSNTGVPGMFWETGSFYSTLPKNQWGTMWGTSQATAKHTNSLILKKCQESRI